MAGGIGSPAYAGTVSFIDIDVIGAVGGAGGAGAGGSAAGGASGGASGGAGGDRKWKTEASPISEWKHTPIRNAEDELRRVQSADTQEFKDTLVGEQDRQRDMQLEAARSPEQQLGNYAYYNWNLAQNNPRGNLNNRSYETTLRMQRLADVVNNRMHYDPGTAATIGGAQGAKSVGQGTATAQKWEPMETQEMRQMRANERVDERARNAGVDLQSRIQAYPQEIQEEGDRLARQLRYYISQMDDQLMSDWQRTVIDTEYRGSWTNFFSELLTKFGQEYRLHVSDKIYREFASLMPAVASEWGQFFANNPVSMPTMTWYLTKTLQDILLDDNISRETKIMAGETINKAVSFLSFRQNIEQFLGSLRSAFGVYPQAGGSASGSGSSIAEIAEYNMNNTRSNLGWKR